MAKNLGFLFFFLNNEKQSNGYFENAKDVDPEYIPSLIGKVSGLGVN